MSIEYDKRAAIIAAPCTGRIPNMIIKPLKLHKSLVY